MPTSGADRRVLGDGIAAALVSLTGGDVELVGVVDGDGVALGAIEPSAEVARR